MNEQTFLGVFFCLKSSAILPFMTVQGNFSDSFNFAHDLVNLCLNFHLKEVKENNGFFSITV